MTNAMVRGGLALVAAGTMIAACGKTANVLDTRADGDGPDAGGQNEHGGLDGRFVGA